MIAGKIQLSGFDYGVGEFNSPDGKEMRALGFKSNQFPFEIQLVFKKEEFEAFIAKCNDTGIVAATKIPKSIIEL